MEETRGGLKWPAGYVAAGLLLFVASHVVHAGDVWDGGSLVDSKWTTVENWDPNGQPAPAENLILKFEGNTRITTDQNVANPPFLLNEVQFTTLTTAAFTLNGNQIRFGGNDPRVVNNTDLTHTFNLPIDIDANKTLDVTRTNVAGTGPVRLLGTISGAGGITKSAPYNLVLGGANANAYTGTTTVSDGVLQLDKGPGTDGTAVAVSGDLVITQNGTVRLFRNEQISDNRTVAINGGILDLGGKTETFKVLDGNGGTLELGAGALTVRRGLFAGEVKGGGNSKLVKLSTGEANNTLKLTGNSINNWTGSLEVKGGTFTLTGKLGSQAFPLKKVTCFAGATLTGANGIWTVQGQGQPGQRGVTVKKKCIIKGGASPGTMLIDGGIEFEPGAVLEIDLDSTTPGNGPGFHTQLEIVGEVLLDNPRLEIVLGYPPSLDERFVIIDNDDTDPVMGHFALRPEGTVIPVSFGPTEYFFEITYQGDASSPLSLGNDVVLTSVQGPATIPTLSGNGTTLLPLLLLALAVLMERRHRNVGRGRHGKSWSARARESRGFLSAKKTGRTSSSMGPHKSNGRPS
jgi:autotransporter-associated beta strand protein